MPAPDAPAWPAEWMRGVLELCVLGVVSQGPTYGYAIAQSLAEAGLGTVKGGTLYPLLTRLETDGLVEATWRAGDGGPGRKFFTLTPAGAAELHRRSPLWAEFAARVATVVPAAATASADARSHTTNFRLTPQETP